MENEFEDILKMSQDDGTRHVLRKVLTLEEKVKELKSSLEDTNDRIWDLIRANGLSCD